MKSAATILLFAASLCAQWPDATQVPVTYHAAYEVPGGSPCVVVPFGVIDLSSPSRKGPEAVLVECFDEPVGAVSLTISVIDGDSVEGRMKVSDTTYELFGGRHQECDADEGHPEPCEYTYDVTGLLRSGENTVVFTHYATLGFKVLEMTVEQENSGDRANVAYQFVDRRDHQRIYCQSWSSSAGIVQCEAPGESETHGEWVRYGRVVPE